MSDNRLEIIPYDESIAEHKKAFADFNIEWLEEYFYVEPVDYEFFESPQKTIIDTGGTIIMAALNDKIVGTGALIKRSNEIYEIAKMAVTRNYQGRGVGKVIVQHLVEDAKLRGLEKVYLVSSTKLPHAVPMYRKLGFVDCPLPIHEVYNRSDITLEKSI